MKLHEFIVRRLLLLIPVMIGVAIFTFAIAHIIPGDPAAIQCGDKCGVIVDYTEDGEPISDPRPQCSRLSRHTCRRTGWQPDPLG